MKQYNVSEIKQEIRDGLKQEPSLILTQMQCNQYLRNTCTELNLDNLEILLYPLIYEYYRLKNPQFIWFDHNPCIFELDIIKFIYVLAISINDFNSRSTSNKLLPKNKMIECALNNDLCGNKFYSMKTEIWINKFNGCDQKKKISKGSMIKLIKIIKRKIGEIEGGSLCIIPIIDRN